MTPKILIIEDDIAFGTMLDKWLGRNGFAPTHVTGIKAGRENITGKKFDLILCDLRLGDGDGIMFLSWLKENRYNIPLIVMTGYADVQSAVSAIKLGAYDFLEKPVNPTLLKEKIEEALSRPAAEISTVREKRPVASDSIISGKSPRAALMNEHIELVAPTNMSVVILGESGTGKEFTARMIHEKSRRAEGKFIAVDCGSLSKELAPSELFGHIKGSFTSAVSDKKGVFEEASGGTVFLDEIGNLSYEVQIQLLRALQERKIRPVGSSADIGIDIRVLTATNENLRDAVAEGRFREDLYHRLNEFSVTVPPLRERPEDIPVFAKHFLGQANRELEKDIKDISPECMEIFMRQRWNGNLRELRNVIRRAVLFCRSDVIGPAHLPEMETDTVPPPNMVSGLQTEEERIRKALEISGGNKSAAAKLLGVDRKTLYNKLHQYNMDI